VPFRPVLGRCEEIENVRDVSTVGDELHPGRYQGAAELLHRLHLRGKHSVAEIRQDIDDETMSKAIASRREFYQFLTIALPHRHRMERESREALFRAKQILEKS
jgi:hypothetical protein